MNYAKHPVTSGVKERKEDLFSDVKRALSEHLMRTDKRYQENSRKSSERNARTRDSKAGIVLELDLAEQ